MNTKPFLQIWEIAGRHSIENISMPVVDVYPQALLSPRYFLWVEILLLVWRSARAKTESVKASYTFTSACSVRDAADRFKKSKLCMEHVGGNVISWSRRQPRHRRGGAAEWGTDELPPSGREGSSLRLSLGA